jgi:twitching motility protein PilT
MIDNQLAAQLLFNHKMASERDILACWPEITPDKDVGMLLVEKGIITSQTYQEMAAYLKSLAPVSETRPAQPVAAESSHGGLAIESNAPVIPPDAIPSGRDPAIVGVEEENWTPAPMDKGGNGTGKTTRAEHQVKKAAASSALPSGSESPAPGKPAPVIPAISAAPKPAATAAGAVRGPDIRAPESVGPDSTWEELLAFARKHEAADLHLSAGNPILLRRQGSLQAATQVPMEQRSLKAWVEGALDPEQLRRFETAGDLELIYTLPGWGRYRVTVIKQRRGWDITARVIPSRIRSFEESGLPESARELTKWAQGLVLVTGPVGCGKSSTLATLVEMVNQERHDHIITIEEPIELIFQPAHCRITQRQIGPHTLNHNAALRAALREDPDIIVISELRDLDTIRLAVSAAETGHLVFGTMNTNNAGRTLYRLIDSFPPEEQGIIRNMISESLRGVISQQLLPRKDGQGMVPAYEMLLITQAVANIIRKDEAHQLGTAMLTGKSQGMVLLDDSLRTLIEKGILDPAEAMARATNPKDFEKYTGRR